MQLQTSDNFLIGS